MTTEVVEIAVPKNQFFRSPKTYLVAGAALAGVAILLAVKSTQKTDDSDVIIVNPEA